MPNLNAPMSVQAQLNRMAPASADAKLGDVLVELIAQVNVLTAAVRAITAKMDLDAGITDVNYTSTVAPAALTIKSLEVRY